MDQKAESLLGNYYTSMFLSQQLQKLCITFHFLIQRLVLTLNARQFIDRAGDICGLYASQLKPSGDTKSHEMGKLFEKTMYQRAKEV